MDEFHEARRLQRWGNLERLGAGALLLAILAGAALVLWHELRKVGGP